MRDLISGRHPNPAVFAVCAGAVLMAMTAAASADPVPTIVPGSPGPTILPGNFFENPDMETETRFEAHRLESPNGNSYADYWHHSSNATWSNGTTDPVVSGTHSLMLFDDLSTGAGMFTQEEFRSFATAIPADAGSPTGLAQKLYFRWHWNFDMFAGTDPSVTMNIRLSNAPIFSLDLGPSLGDNKVIRTGSSNGWEQVTVELDIPVGAQSFDMIVLTEGSKDALGVMFVDDVSVSMIAPVTTLDGDLNGDGFVGIEDLNIVLGNWNANVTAGDLLSGDPTGDGFVGIEDLNQVLGNWNNGTPPLGGSAVPEPASLIVLTIGGLAVLRRRTA